MGRMRGVLSGPGGSVGSVARGVLEAAGHAVVGLAARLYEGCDLAPLTPPPAPELPIDLRDVQLADLAGIDAVVHLGALSNDPIRDLDENLTYAINHVASARL